MAPIRRYLRISKYSVLECRIFLENPADGPRWLLRPQDPALPRVFEAVKPLVLPKLREENERLKGKGKKKKSVKDVRSGEDFEVSVFLTEVNTRHALMVKSKTFKHKTPVSKTGTGVGGRRADPVMIREESDEDDVGFDDIPAANADDDAIDDFEPQMDDKKKLAFNTTYEGFNIWGFVLCLLVDRKGAKSQSGDGHAQALMEEWISTQKDQQDDREES